MQNASLLPVPELTPAAGYIPLSPLSYEVAEEYAMGMLSALQGTAALGAGLHIAGSLLIVYGQTLVKVAQLMEETSEAGRCWQLPPQISNGEPYQWRSTDGKWRVQRLASRLCMTLGWGVFGVGNLLRFAAMRFAAQMVLSGLGSLQFVMIPIVSNLLLGDKYTWEAFVSIVIILGGNALIVVYGPAEVKFTLEQLRLQWTTTSMVVFIVVLGLLLAALHWGKGYVARLRAEAQAASVRARWRSKALKEPQYMVFGHAMLFSAYAGLIGAWSVLFSKSITYIITAPWPSQLVDWYSWFCVLAFVGSAAFWIKATNQGLHLFSSSLIIPLMQACWTAQSIVEGGIYFDEFKAMESDNLGWLLLGMLLAIGGALFMGCAAFISEQHAMISHVIVLEDPLHPRAGLGSGGMFPLHNGGSSAPAPTTQSDWQHNMAALDERVRAGDAGRSEKVDATNMLGGAGPVATFVGPPVNPKVGLLGSSQAAVNLHLPVIPDLGTIEASPLHSARSADSATSMRSAFSTMHPATFGSNHSNIHSRRTSAVGEPLAEFEDVFDADDLEMGRYDGEDASLLRPDTGRHTHQQSSSDDPGAHLSGNLSRPDAHSEALWGGVLQSPAVIRFGQATKSWGAKLKSKYAEYRETNL
ncbi:hypothetical protein ABBQ32_009092 [Trebouxia sp. C0010 RCD-2024]